MIRKIKEPEFMRELHKIRENLSKKWNKMTSEEMLNSLHESSRWLKAQLRSPSFK
jgi:hypothetical protein